MAEAQRATYLLIAGAALGLGAAMWSALGVGDALSRYTDAIAVVDGAPISRASYQSAIEGLASAKRNPLTESEKRDALDRIVDEQLLLRRALDLGLAESDPSSRKAIVNAMLQFSIADAAKLEPTDEQLSRFYAERPKLIAPQPLLTVRAVSLDMSESAKIDAIKKAIASGTGFADALKAARATPLLMPEGPIVPAKIAEYAGASVRDMALTLEKGGTIGPIAIGRRVVFVHLIDRNEAPPPPLAEVRDVVVEEWRRRASEDAFANYVASLRSQARISYAADAPKAEGK